MGDVQPRYEFRVWGEDLAELRERLERRATPVKVASKETYLISKATYRCNAKIRGNLVEIKVLIAEYRGLGRWKPVLLVPFPLDQSLIVTQIFPCLEISPPKLSRARFEIGEFLNEAIGATPEIAVVELSKTRFKFSFDMCLAEFTVVLLNDMARNTVAFESADPKVAGADPRNGL